MGNGIFEYSIKPYLCNLVQVLQTPIMLARIFIWLVVHRNGNMKLDHLLLNRESCIVVADLGLCKEYMSPNDLTPTFCGTTDSIAPEVLTEDSYTCTVDC